MASPIYLQAAFGDKFPDWSQVTDSDFVEDPLHHSQSLLEDGMGVNPFSMVVGAQEIPSNNPQWLQVAPEQDTWVFGDERDYPGFCIRIRDVNKKMARYIFQHFDDGKSMNQRRTPVNANAPPIITNIAKAPAPHPDEPASRAAFRREPPVVIVGTAGTGKSAFSMYLLFCLLQKHPNDAVIYRQGSACPNALPYFFLRYRGTTWWHPSIREPFSPLTFKLLTNNGSRPIWAVLDGEASIPAGPDEVRHIVLISPGMQEAPAVERLLKPGGTALLVNPPWSLNDLDAVREHAYHDSVDGDDVRQSFEQWGGIPRIALDWGNDPLKQQELRHALESPNPQKYFSQKYFRQAGFFDIDNDTASDFIFHILPGQCGIPDDIADDDPTIEFSYPASCWATSWIQDRIWEGMKVTAAERSMLKFMIDRSNNLAVRAYALEPHVLHTLHTLGLYGRMKFLSSSTGVPVEMRPQFLPPTQKTYFNSFTDIYCPLFNAPLAGHFYLPRQKNHAPVNLYIPDHGVILQITVPGHRHPVRWDGIKNALDSKIFATWQQSYPLPDPPTDPNAKPDDSKPKRKERKIRLIFLCELNYENFEKQNLIGTAGTGYKDAENVAECDELVEQYAWELNVETQLGINLGYTDVVSKRRREISLAGQWGIDDLDAPETKKRKTKKRKVTASADQIMARKILENELGRKLFQS